LITDRTFVITSETLLIAGTGPDGSEFKTKGGNHAQADLFKTLLGE